MNVTTDSETLRIPLDEIRPFIRSGCGVCPDMTAELADLSVGMVEGRAGWNTVIVRTQAGEELLLQAEGAGIVETKPLRKGYLAHLREASRLKKQRALKALEILPCDRSGFEHAIREIIPAKALTANLKAFDQGKNSIREM